MIRSLNELAASDALDCADVEIIELDDLLVITDLGTLAIDEVEEALRAAA
jgi:hypothetical protein